MKNGLWQNGIRPFIRKIRISMQKSKISRRYGVEFEPGSDISLKTVFHGKARIAGKLIDSEIGYGSFLASDSYLVYTRIGKYCSIGNHVTIIRGRHPSRVWVSTSPCFYSPDSRSGVTYVGEQKFQEFKWVSEEDKVALEIGNDVWIGDHATLMEGITVGDGAIVAAGANVIRSVPPYAVVGGNPAKVIRYRFEPEQIEKLLALKWWDRPEEWILEHAEEFEDVKRLLKG